MATRSVLSGLRTGTVLRLPDSDAKHLIRPTDGYCFVTAGWRREASYPAYGRVLFVGRISASAIRHFL
ncbi:hypothetical protein LFZ5_02660 [Salmonella enterica subsp. enterica serovar Apapa str. SA20060561]|nr:hypothetical protein LFZ5_02660 [Salmonella enterica subsp. enterica serovar Apapa str. SA20060561]